MGRSVFLEGLLSLLGTSLPYLLMFSLGLFALYLVAREVVAYNWLAERISDAALGVWQLSMLVVFSVGSVTLVCGFLALSVLDAYFTYYYPYLFFTGLQ